MPGGGGSASPGLPLSASSASGSSPPPRPASANSSNHDSNDDNKDAAFALSPKWCRNCDCKHEQGVEFCPLRKPSQVFSDAVIDFSNKKEEEEQTEQTAGLDLSKSFAQLSLPASLMLAERTAPDAAAAAAAAGGEAGGAGGGATRQLGVLARAPLKAFAQFGPLQGEPMLEKDVPEDFDMKDLWQVFSEDGRRLYVSTVNPEKSNWLRYLRPAPQRRARNVAAVVRDDQIFFVTMRDVDKEEELLYWIDDPDLMWTKKRAEKKSKEKQSTRRTFSLLFFSNDGLNGKAGDSYDYGANHTYFVMSFNFNSPFDVFFSDVFLTVRLRNDARVNDEFIPRQFH